MRKFTDKLILILNLIGAAGLLFSYLAPFINPVKLVLPALFGLAYPYLLMVNLVFVCYWLIRLKKEILISLVVVLLGWNHLTNLLPINENNIEPPEEANTERVFNVLSYNVRTFNLYQWNKDPTTRENLFRFLREQSPDIICFQEFYSEGKGLRSQDIAKELPFCPYSAIYYTSAPASISGSGIATYSSFPIIKRSRIPFNSISNAAMYTDHCISGDTIRVFNLHLESIRFREENYIFMDTIKFAYNNEQMKEIRKIGSRLKSAFIRRAEQAAMIANYIKDSPYPVLVMGDFNDTPQSFAYRNIRKGIHDAYRKAGRGFGNTYAGELPSFRIDYIMYSDPFIPYQFKRIKKEYSDHFPVTARFYLPPNPEGE
ncbi:MAG: endonuclease/exonuclease/phosphatase family protein [Bacteroidota bacterium]